MLIKLLNFECLYFYYLYTYSYTFRPQLYLCKMEEDNPNYDEQNEKIDESNIM